MYESLVPAVGMGGMGPLNRWVGSSAVVLANQAAIANNWPIIALKHAALRAALGNSCLIDQYYSTRACPPAQWTYGIHFESRN